MKKFCWFVVFISLVISVASEWNEDCENPPDLNQYDGYCCHEDKFIGMEDIDNTEIIKECAEKFGLTVNNRNDVILTSETLEANLCFSECVFEANNYTENGTLNLDLMKIDARTYNHTENLNKLENIFINAIDLCGIKAEEKVTELKKLPNAEIYFKTNCSPTPLIFNECLAKEYYKNCPEEYWSKDIEDCKDARAYTIKCLV
ncbi:uncharacterized protein LOC129613566 [Condylostylus longicornis]|uniref:uncharacterized protein LOC129613566 n=1 Tax=Condylostylus longicornis TaxID=2530218 RepID=UPI00244E46FE|nr:uncharacterized protein LOC129613566 [Condylostylus longicornis]